MLKIAGRGPDGLAKAIKTDMGGNVLTANHATSNKHLDWHYTTALGQIGSMQVPEHDGTVWGARWGTDDYNKIYNFVDVTDPSTLTISPVIALEGTIFYIHPYREGEDLKIAVVTCDLTNKVIRAYLMNGIEDTAPILTLEYNGIISKFGCDSYYDGLTNIILIPEYGQLNTPKKLWASFDGGRTYVVIKETTQVGTDMANHWHTAHYDRFSGRIWASEGDASNSAINWSDNLGVTWNRNTDLDIQPTLIKSFANCVVFGHDEGYEKAGLSVWYRNNGVNRNALSINRVLSISDQSAPDMFAMSTSWGQNGDTAYMLFIRTSGTVLTEYIYKTDDGGNSWIGVSVFKNTVSRIDLLSGVTKQGHIVGRLRLSSNPNWLTDHLVYSSI